MTITGTTIGASTTPIATARAAPRIRHSPKAAGVPSAVASPAAALPIISEFHSAGSQKSDPKKSRYQRSDSPGSG